MELKEAIQLLKDLNHWRRFDGEIEDSPEMPNPKKKQELPLIGF